MNKNDELVATFAYLDGLKDALDAGQSFTSDELLAAMDDLISGVADSIDVSDLAALLNRYNIEVYPVRAQRYQHVINGQVIPMTTQNFQNWLNEFDDLLPDAE